MAHFVVAVCLALLAASVSAQTYSTVWVTTTTYSDKSCVNPTNVYIQPYESSNGCTGYTSTCLPTGSSGSGEQTCSTTAPAGTSSLPSGYGFTIGYLNATCVGTASYYGEVLNVCLPQTEGSNTITGYYKIGCKGSTSVQNFYGATDSSCSNSLGSESISYSGCVNNQQVYCSSASSMTFSAILIAVVALATFSFNY